MSAILISLLENGLKFALFIGIAWAGIICGKKYRDYKDVKNEGASTEKK